MRVESDAGLAKLRSTKEEMRDLEGAATRAEKGVSGLGRAAASSSGGLAGVARGANSAGNSFRGLSREVAKLAAGYLSLAAAARGINFLFASADQFRSLENRIRLVTDSVEDFEKVQSGLIGISRETYATIEATAQGYQRMAAASERLGISQDRLLGVTKTVNQAVALSGATTQAAEASLVQFGQALSNNFQASAQEINSLNEQVFALSDAIARGLTITTGVETFRGDLKRLAEEGKLTAEGVIAALEAVAPEIEKTFADLARTRGQIETVIGQNIKILADEALGPLTETQIGVYQDIAAALASPEAVAQAREFGRAINEIANDVIENFDSIVKAAQGIGAAFAFTAAVNAVASLRVAVLALNAAIIANPIGLLVTALSLAVGAIVAYRKEIAFAIAGTEDIGIAIKAVYEALRDNLVGAFNAVAGAAKSAGEALGQFLPPQLTAVISGAADQVERLVGYLREIDERSREVSGKGPLGFASDLLNFKLSGQVNNPLQNLQRDIQQRASALEQEQRFRDNLLKSFETGLPQGLTGLPRAFDAAAGGAHKYTAAIVEAAAANDNTVKTIGDVEKSLRDQLSTAQKLAQAARGGRIEYEIAVNTAELDGLAEQAVEKAKEAGEELSFSVARSIIGRIAELEIEKDIQLNAEVQLKELTFDAFQQRIDEFSARVSGVDIAASGPNAGRLIASLDSQFQALAADLDDMRLQIDPADFDRLQQTLTDAGVEFGLSIEDAARRGALGFAQRIEQAIKDGASRLVVTARVTADLADIGAGFLDSVTDAVEAFKRAGERSFEAITSLASRIATSLERGLKDLGGLIGGSFGSALGGIGEVVGAVGAVTGFISSAVNFFKELFGKTSNFTAQGVFNASTGEIAGVGQDKGAEDNAKARDALIESISEAGKQISLLVGGASARNDPGTSANEQFINVAVRSDRKTGEAFIDVGFQGANGEPSGGGRFSDVEAAFDAAIRLTIQSLQGGQSALLDYAKAAAASGQSFEDIVSVLDVLNRALNSGQETLARYAIEAANGGLSADQISNGIEKIDAALRLAAPELSNVEQELASLDAAINPAIAALKAVGQSFSEITEIGQTAGRAIGSNFIDGIRDELDRLNNADLADFKAILRQQAQDLEDAQSLLARGFISPDELRLVQQRNALQQTKFFEGLDEEALNNLGDYLGLIRENGGEAAVVLLQFNQELDRTRDSLTSGLSQMREEADKFFAAAQANFNLSDDIQRRLSSETGTAQLATFRAELQGLLQQVQTGDTATALNAAEQAPDIARQFIDLAESRFQGSAGLAQARDFVTDILNQIGEASNIRGLEREDAISLAEKQVALLDDLKSILSSPDPAIDALQGILAQGEIQNAVLRDLLDQYVQLSFNSPSQSYTPGDVQAAATQFVIPSDLKITNTVTTDSPSVSLAINQAAAQANDNAQTQIDVLEDVQRSVRDLSDAIAKLDGTLRQQA